MATVVAAALALAGCGDAQAIRPGDIRTYTTAKAPPPITPAAASPVRYEVPDGWQDLGGGGMRLTTLTIGSPESGLEVTLSRARGAVRDNVIRWQKQLVGEADATAVAAAADRAIAAAETVDVAGTPATIVLLDAAGFPDAKGVEGQVMLAAIIPGGADSLFVKFRGSADVAAREKDNFNRFVASLRWK
ncbi:MAG: hypothetical protein ACK6CT_05370 [Planctomycetia bacterium]